MKSTGSDSRAGSSGPATSRFSETTLTAVLPWLLAILGPTILFGPMLVRGEVLSWGTPILQFLPWHQFAVTSMAQGHLPLWNPWLGMGAPLLANHQSALLYPPNLLLGLVGPAWGHGLLVLLHLSWAGVGMVVLARRLNLSIRGQMVASTAFSLSGYVIARAGFLSMNAALAWVPWILLAAHDLGRAGSTRRELAETASAVGILSLTLALQWLAGHAQTAWYTLVLASIWLVWFAHANGGARGAARAAGLAVAALALAFGLAAVQILPSWEYWRESQRAAGVDVGAAFTYSFWPWRALGLLAPDIFGSPVTGDFRGYGNYWEDATYIGVFPLLFALTSVWNSARSSGGQPRGFLRLQWLVVLGSFALALGSHTPLFPFLFRHVPTFDAFQAPTRWNVVLILSLVVLAAYGAEAWSSPRGRALYASRLATAGAGGAVLVSLLVSQLSLGIAPSIPRAAARAFFWLFLAGGLTLVQGKLRISQVNLALAGFLLVDLGLAGAGLNPSRSADWVASAGALSEFARDGHRIYMPADLEYEIKFNQTHRFDTFSPPIDWHVVRDSGLPNTSLLDGVASVGNFDPLLPGRYAEWIDILAQQSPPIPITWLAWMDVSWLAMPAPLGEAGARYQAVPGPARARVARAAVCVMDPSEARATIVSAQFDPAAIAVLEGCDGWEEDWGGGEGSAVHLQGSDPNSVTVEVDAPEGGWLVLSEVWFPGWQASVNGAAARIYRADYLFRAVSLRPGTSKVVLEYRPASFGWGRTLSFVSWIGLGLGILWRRRA